MINRIAISTLLGIVCMACSFGQPSKWAGNAGSYFDDRWHAAEKHMTGRSGAFLRNNLNPTIDRACDRIEEVGSKLIDKFSGEAQKSIDDLFIKAQELSTNTLTVADTMLTKHETALDDILGKNLKIVDSIIAKSLTDASRIIDKDLDRLESITENSLNKVDTIAGKTIMKLQGMQTDAFRNIDSIMNDQMPIVFSNFAFVLERALLWSVVGILGLLALAYPLFTTVVARKDCNRLSNIAYAYFTSLIKALIFIIPIFIVALVMDALYLRQYNESIQKKVDQISIMASLFEHADDFDNGLFLRQKALRFLQTDKYRYNAERTKYLRDAQNALEKSDGSSMNELVVRHRKIRETYIADKSELWKTDVPFIASDILIRVRYFGERLSDKDICDEKLAIEKALHIHDSVEVRKSMYNVIDSMNPNMYQYASYYYVSRVFNELSSKDKGLWERVDEAAKLSNEICNVFPDYAYGHLLSWQLNEHLGRTSIAFPSISGYEYMKDIIKPKSAKDYKSQANLCSDRIGTSRPMLYDIAKMNIDAFSMISNDPKAVVIRSQEGKITLASPELQQAAIRFSNLSTILKPSVSARDYLKMHALITALPLASLHQSGVSTALTKGPSLSSYPKADGNTIINVSYENDNNITIFLNIIHDCIITENPVLADIWERELAYYIKNRYCSNDYVQFISSAIEDFAKRQAMLADEHADKIKFKPLLEDAKKCVASLGKSKEFRVDSILFY